MKNKLIRQGDVLIITNESMSIPEGSVFKKITVLHKGTNHDHYFSSGEIFETFIDDKKYIKVLTDATLSHGRGASTEHKDVILKEGLYLVQIQSEQDHVKKIKRSVID